MLRAPESGGVCERVLTSQGLLGGPTAQSASLGSHRNDTTQRLKRHEPSPSEPGSNNWRKLLRLTLIVKDLVTRITAFAFL